MMITSHELDSHLRHEIMTATEESLRTNAESLADKLRSAGFFDLANDIAGARNTTDREAVMARLYSLFMSDFVKNIAIENLTPGLVEFECLYGLTDPVTNTAGRDISFLVTDTTGHMPISLSPENIKTYFSVSAPSNEERIGADTRLSCRIKTCDYVPASKSTRVTLEVHVGNAVFQSDGVFTLTVEVHMGLAENTIIAARATAKFIVKNSFADFFSDDFTKAESTTTAAAPVDLFDSAYAPSKEVYMAKGVLSTKKKNLRINFDKQGRGTPTVLCGNGAFKAGVPSESSVNISFRTLTYKSIQSRLAENKINEQIRPETSVWVEWEDFVVVYQVQYKGFLT